MDSVIYRNVKLPEELRQRLEQSLAEFRSNIDYLSRHHVELVKLYPDEWVAIINRQVTAHSKSSSKEVIEELDELGVDRSAAFVQFLWAKPVNLIL